MKKRIIGMISIVIVLLFVFGIAYFNGNIGKKKTMIDTSKKEEVAKTEEVKYVSKNFERTGWAKDIPESYKRSAINQGHLEIVEYDTIDYTNNKETRKRAVVYIPSGYDESKKYNILYLMHGWTGYPGDFFDYSNIKNILDNMIENGDIEPLIVVAATFDAESKGQDRGRSIEELEPFHLDLENRLIPYIESHYSTYAESTSKEDLIASREHRAFGGFSLGGVTTWWIFKHDLDIIKYFLPMSGDARYVAVFGGLYYPKETVDEIEKIVDSTNKDYFIYAALGTNDARYDQVNNQMVEMLKREKFKNSFVYYQVKDAYHDFNATDIDMYNGLQTFFKEGSTKSTNISIENSLFTKDTRVVDVINDEAFGDYGYLLFPANRNIPENLTLENAEDILMWYNNINPDKTVEIMNYFKQQALDGNQIFYDIYTEEEKKEDPSKRDTGLFYFRGNPGKKFAIVNAGGGFVFVGAFHDSFPHALELSKKGYNAFALIYRPGADSGVQDLARAIAFIHEHADELEVDVNDYSLWGGSAGARLAARLGTYGTESFGEKKYPRPAAIIMEYTGLGEVTGDEPPTYNAVGTSDGIANYRIMQSRIEKIRQNGTDAEIDVFEGLPHGFGLGEGTIAEGWIDNAIAFWKRNMKSN